MRRYLTIILLFIKFYAWSQTNKLNPFTPPNDWNKHELYGIAEISVPPTMELRDRGSAYAQQLPNLTRSYENIVFQQKGLDKLSKSAFTRYARILVSVVIGKRGDFYKKNEIPHLSTEDKQALHTAIRDDVMSIGATIIENPQFRRIDISGIKALEVKYKRSGTNNYTTTTYWYILQNNDKMFKIVISYRDQGKAYFLPDLTNVIKTFKWY